MKKKKKKSHNRAASGQNRRRSKAIRPVRDALERKHWISAGIQTLASQGVAAVRIELLAKDLQVTKGSFYWHFADRQELLNAVLAEWRRSTLTAVVESIWGKPADAYQKLDRLWRICFSGRIDNPGGPLEAALRQWSIADPKVADLIAEVDSERIAFVERIYRELPVDDPAGHARLFYAFVVGRNTIAMRLTLPDERSDALSRGTILLQK